MMKRKQIVFVAGVALVALAAVGGSVEFTKQPMEAKAYTPTAEESSKLDLRNKMWSSIERFNTVKGTYKMSNKQTGLSATAEFQVRETGRAGSYSLIHSSTGHVYENRVDGVNLVQKLDGKVMQSVKVVPVNPSEKPAYMYGIDPQEQSANLRRDPAFAGPAAQITLPQELATNYLEDMSRWNIAGSVDFLGRTATVVTGELPAFMKTKHDSESFKLWVDQETGMLLKEEETNQAGEIIHSMEVTSLQVNGPVNESEMQIDPTDVRDNVK